MKKTRTLPKKAINQQARSFLTTQTILAGYVVVIILLQLFSFEDFWTILTQLGLGAASAKLLSILLVVSEVTALPFWLKMSVPSWLTRMSMWSGVFALVLLSVLQVAGFVLGKVVIFGATFAFPAGVWPLFVLIALWSLVIWSLMDYNDKLGDSKLKAK